MLKYVGSQHGMDGFVNPSQRLVLVSSKAPRLLKQTHNTTSWDQVQSRQEVRLKASKRRSAGAEHLNRSCDDEERLCYALLPPSTIHPSARGERMWASKVWIIPTAKED
jgi:hypothetical protein